MNPERISAVYLTMLGFTTTVGIFTYLHQGRLSFHGLFLSLGFGLIWPLICIEALSYLFKEALDEPKD